MQLEYYIYFIFLVILEREYSENYLIFVYCCKVVSVYEQQVMLVCNVNIF